MEHSFCLKLRYGSEDGCSIWVHVGSMFDPGPHGSRFGHNTVYPKFSFLPTSQIRAHGRHVINYPLPLLPGFATAHEIIVHDLLHPFDNSYLLLSSHKLHWHDREGRPWHRSPAGRNAGRSSI